MSSPSLVCSSPPLSPLPRQSSPGPPSLSPGPPSASPSPLRLETLPRVGNEAAAAAKAVATSGSKAAAMSARTTAQQAPAQYGLEDGCVLPRLRLLRPQSQPRRAPWWPLPRSNRCSPRPPEPALAQTGGVNRSHFGSDAPRPQSTRAPSGASRFRRAEGPESFRPCLVAGASQRRGPGRPTAAVRPARRADARSEGRCCIGLRCAALAEGQPRRSIRRRVARAPRLRLPRCARAAQRSGNPCTHVALEGWRRL